MSVVVVAEKPSVAQALANVLGAYKRRNGYLEGNGYLVSWCFGHLAEYVMPDFYDSRYQYWRFEGLPIIPERWELAVAVEKSKQFEILSNLMNSVRKSEWEKTGKSTPSGGQKFVVPVEYVVNACDAGREGELIFKHLYDLSGCRLPVKRLWISSLEESAIAEGFANLRDSSEYKGLRDAAVCRAQADWLVGINATRAYTTLYHKKLAVGRVQTPTLAMLVERQQEISGFKKETWFQVRLEGDGFSAVSEKIANEKDCDALVDECYGKSAVVTKVEQTMGKTSPPALYDLTTLQREANRYFGYTAQETLSALQELYESRFITYPRTDSQYITPDMENMVLDLLDAIPDSAPYLAEVAGGRNVSRIINPKKVSDHHAILPTREAMAGELNLSGIERNLFALIVQRLAQAVADDCTFQKTEIACQCAGNDFTAKGKVIVEAGYKAVSEAFRKSIKNEAAENTENSENPEAAENTVISENPEDTGAPEDIDEPVTAAPGEECMGTLQNDSGSEDEWLTAVPLDIREGMEIPEVLAVKVRRYTSPPRPYTEDTLLSAMETAGNKDFDQDTEKKGLGTPATRASMIEKLVSSGYVVRKGKQLFPTKEGEKLIRVMPEILKSASLTAEWENQLLDMERGSGKSEDFMKGITGLISKLLADCKQIPEEELCRFDTRERIGKCPICGKPVYEGNRNFHCADQSCTFAIWKESNYLSNMKKTITKSMARELLDKGRTHAEDFYSAKTGKNFTADLVMQIVDGRVRYSMEFPSKKKAPPDAKKADARKTGAKKAGAKAGVRKKRADG